jgi:hypothetical protein
MVFWSSIVNRHVVSALLGTCAITACASRHDLPALGVVAAPSAPVDQPTPAAQPVSDTSVPTSPTTVASPPTPTAVPQTAPRQSAPADGLSPEIRKALTTTEGKRVYETARPGPGVPLLALASPAWVETQPGGSITVQARSAPGALVNFWAVEGGVFPNQRASITVLADDQGVATTTVTANSGTLDDTSIVIGSPQAVGLQTVTMHVLYPGSIHARARQPAAAALPASPSFPAPEFK